MLPHMAKGDLQMWLGKGLWGREIFLDYLVILKAENLSQFDQTDIPMEEEDVIGILPDILALQMEDGAIAKEYEQHVEAGNGIESPESNAVLLTPWFYSEVRGSMSDRWLTELWSSKFVLW